MTKEKTPKTKNNILGKIKWLPCGLPDQPQEFLDRVPEYFPLF
jgi:hypothetical protein